MNRRIDLFHARTVLSVLLVPGLAALAMGCSSDSSTETATTNSDPKTSTSATGATTTSPAVGEDMRTKRYCEVLQVQITNGNGVADVFNTYPLNECPEDKWKALDPVAIAKDAKVTIATLNGPRYWLMNHIEKAGGAKDLPIKDFGGMEMYRQASVDVGPIVDAQKPYVTHAVDRKTVFVFNAGETVYELTGADGTKYVMQSWSQQKDPTLEEAGLETLGTKLTPPSGWKYAARKLTEELRVDTTQAPAHVLQDDFANSYSQIPG